MRPDALLRVLRRQPFRPFRFYVLEHTVFEVRHPEQILVEGSVVEYSHLLEAAPDDLVLIALVYLTRIEPIAPPPASTPTSG